MNSNTPKVRKRTWSELADAYTRQTKTNNKISSLLDIAAVYVESYAGRFPENVRPEHLRALRKWRAERER